MGMTRPNPDWRSKSPVRRIGFGHGLAASVPMMKGGAGGVMRPKGSGGS